MLSFDIEKLTYCVLLDLSVKVGKGKRLDWRQTRAYLERMLHGHWTVLVYRYKADSL